jgi:predicted nucleic acid-binding protein
VNGYLLDTNVTSEFSRDRPEPRVVEWLKKQPVATIFLSAVTIGEIRKGLMLLPPSRRLSVLEQWFYADLLIGFRQRILPVTVAVAERWGVLDGQCRTPAGGMIASTESLLPPCVAKSGDAARKSACATRSPTLASTLQKRTQTALTPAY